MLVHGAEGSLERRQFYALNVKEQLLCHTLRERTLLY